MMLRPRAPVALVGSGEFLPVMEEVDRELLAGAAALSEVAHELPTDVRRLGLGLIGGLVVIPHFDRVERRAPEIIGRSVSSLADGQLLVGIDENTALVGGPDRWRVRGRGRVSVIDTEGCRHVHPADTELTFAAEPDA